MGSDHKANLTVIHHIGPGADGAGKMTGNGDNERGGRHVQDAGDPTDDGAGPGGLRDGPADAGDRANAGEAAAGPADARGTIKKNM
ncbi:hypothetical protein [Arthrobacter sp. NPDC058192]|uniref:hypothetical protein n=1 Tax=Arthrobacter sp. NPDC058192 TaxID=3346372 RepID=UPI0036EAFFB8